MIYKTLSTLQDKLDGELRSKDHLLFGNYRGFSYYLQLNPSNFSHILLVNAKGESPFTQAEIDTFKESFPNIDDVKFDNDNIKIHFLPFVKEKRTIDSIYATFHSLCDLLEKKGYKNLCQKSQSDDMVELYETNQKEKMFLSESYATSWNEKELAKYQEEMNQPYSSTLALIVGFLGTLPGAALWAYLFYQNQWYAGSILGAIVMVIGSLLGYLMISKKIDKKSLVRSSIMIGFLLFVYEFLAINTYFFIYLPTLQSSYYIVKSFFDPLKYMFEILNSVFLLQIVFTLLLAIIASTITISFFVKSFFDKRKNAYGVKKVVTDIIYLDDDDTDEDEEETDETKENEKEEEEDDE